MLFNTSWVFSLVTYLKRKRGKPRKKNFAHKSNIANFTCHSLSSSSTNLSFSFCWALLIATFPKVDINIISYHISSYIIYHIYVNVQAIKDSACFHRPMKDSLKFHSPKKVFPIVLMMIFVDTLNSLKSSMPSLSMSLSSMYFSSSCFYDGAMRAIFL